MALPNYHRSLPSVACVACFSNQRNVCHARTCHTCNAMGRCGSCRWVWLNRPDGYGGGERNDGGPCGSYAPTV